MLATPSKLEFRVQPDMESSSPAAPEIIAGDFWVRLRLRFNVGHCRQVAAPGIEVHGGLGRNGRRYWMVRSPSGLAYRRLEEDEHQLLLLMDGSRTVRELVVDHFRRTGSFAFPRVLHLVGDLHAAGFLRQPPRPIYLHLARRLRRETQWQRVRRIWMHLISAEFVIRDLDHMAARVYGAGGALLFRRPAQVVYLLVSVSGATVFVAQLLHPSTASFEGGSALRAGLALTLLYLLSVLIHEMAHALATKAYGRSVRRAGVLLYLGMPTFFVDTTDIWMADRHARLVVSWSGPLSGFVFAGATSLLALAEPSTWLAPVLIKVALLCYLTNLLNLMPLLELDGYYILIDLLDMPMLRHRSMAFLRTRLWSKLRHRDRWSNEDRIFLAFGVTAWVYTIYSLMVALLFWVTNVSGALGSVWGHMAIPLRAAVVVAVAVALGPLVADLLWHVWLRARALWRGGRGWWRARNTREALELLSTIPWLEGLAAPQRAALAAACRPRRARPGRVLVREGTRGDSFFILHSGNADVTRSDHGGDPVARLGPGDYFGERALLNDSPRQASVTATTICRLYVLSNRDFHHLLAPHLRALAEADRLLGERDAMAQLPLFRELTSAGLDLLARHLRSWSAAAGSEIVREGDPGDLFYLIASGQAEVLQGGSVVAVLGRGDHFGEVALLWDVPRTATVRARSTVTGWTLARSLFLDVLGGYLDLQGQLVAVANQRQQLRGEVLSSSSLTGTATVDSLEAAAI